MADKEELQIVKGILPIVGIGTVLFVAIGLLGLAFTGRRVYAQDGRYLVSVRYPGQLNDIREFVQPDNPDVLAILSQYGSDYWGLYDFVCRNICYRRDIGEFWQTPTETLARRWGDCEDTSLLLCSLLQNAHVALGSYRGYGHAWCEHRGQMMETTFASAQPVSDPEDYCPYLYFNDQEVIELWPGALGEVFQLERNEPIKLNLMAEAIR